MLSIFEFLRGNEKQKDDLVDIIKSVAIIEDIISSGNDASITKKSSIEKDFSVDVEQLPEITTIVNRMPYIKEKSVVEKDKSRTLNKVEDFGKDLGGVREGEDGIEERVIENGDEIEEGITSTQSGMQTIHSLVLLENLTLEIVLPNY